MDQSEFFRSFNRGSKIKLTTNRHMNTQNLFLLFLIQIAFVFVFCNHSESDDNDSLTVTGSGSDEDGEKGSVGQAEDLAKIFDDMRLGEGNNPLKQLIIDFHPIFNLQKIIIDLIPTIPPVP